MGAVPAVIQTRYKGYRFRSRLEARWAVFLDNLPMAWEYEKEGYRLRDGSLYLPDFWLPGPRIWLEIKGSRPTPEEISRCRLLRDETDRAVLLLCGLPCELCGLLFAWDMGGSSGGASEWVVSWAQRMFQRDYGFYLRCDETRGRQIYADHMMIEVLPVGSDYVFSGAWEEICALRARAARFEYGEYPKRVMG